MAHETDTPAAEAQGSMTQTLIWVAVMIAAVALLAYFVV